MIEIGRVCVKLAGRDASKKCVIVDILDDKFVLIDGETRRRRCNVLHIEPLSEVIKIEKNASHDDITTALKEMGMEARETKPKQKTQKPTKKRKTPEQLKVQKEEKRKIRDIFRPKKKEEKVSKESSLEEKAGLTEEKKETSLEAKAGLDEETESKEKQETKSEKKETKSKTAKKTAKNNE